MTDVIRELIEEGHEITAADLEGIAPYLHEHINRFGMYSTEEIDLTPEAFDPHLNVDFDTEQEEAPRR